jgi:hypothetical protein
VRPGWSRGRTLCRPAAGPGRLRGRPPAVPGAVIASRTGSRNGLSPACPGLRVKRFGVVKRLGGVPASPRLRQEQVAELGLPGSRRRTVPRYPPENDLADHGSVEIDYEKAGAPLGRPGHLALKLVTRPGATEVGAHLWRGQQLDERRPVPGLGLTEHESLGPDRLRRPADGPQVGHPRKLADGQTTQRETLNSPASRLGPVLIDRTGLSRPAGLATAGLAVAGLTLPDRAVTD